jgi:hypothetical protein
MENSNSLLEEARQSTILERSFAEVLAVLTPITTLSLKYNSK